MRKPSTRRSVSIKGRTYDRVKSYCKKQGRSVSGFLEELVARELEGVEPEVDEVKPAKRRGPSKTDEIIAAHFTW